jgi:hypothetical protein
MNAINQSEGAAIARNFCGGSPTPVLSEFAEAMAKAEPMKVYLSWDEFNDDDVYLYMAATGRLVRHIPVNSPEVFCARYHGMKVLEGQSWARGRNAKTLSLWRPA